MAYQASRSRLTSPRSRPLRFWLVTLGLSLACAPGSEDAPVTARGAFRVDSIPTVDIGDEADGLHAIFSGPVFPALLSGKLPYRVDSKEWTFRGA